MHAIRIVILCCFGSHLLEKYKPARRDNPTTQFST